MLENQYVLLINDVIKAIKAGEDCNSIARCSDAEIDKSILKACLEEKQKRETVGTSNINNCEV